MKFKSMEQANNYVLKHGVKMPNGQVCLLKPLYVYKKVMSSEWYGSETIANLIIPVGAFVNLASRAGLKFRANEAITYSIVGKYTKKPLPVGYAKHSQGTNPYKYHSALEIGISEKEIAEAAYSITKQGKARFTKNSHKNAIAIPRNDFDASLEECRSGIHFFLDQSRALAY